MDSDRLQWPPSSLGKQWGLPKVQLLNLGQVSSLQMLPALTGHTWAHTDRAAEAHAPSAQEQRSNLLQLSTLCFLVLGGFFCWNELFTDPPLGLTLLPSSKNSLAIYMRYVAQPVKDEQLNFQVILHLEGKGPAHTIWTKGNALINFLIGIAWHQWLNYPLNFISEGKGRSYWINSKKVTCRSLSLTW